MGTSPHEASDHTDRLALGAARADNPMARAPSNDGHAVARSRLLRALSHPDGIAILGASDDATKLGGRPVSNLRTSGYGGRIMPVNPRRETVQGLRAYRTVSDIPGPVDVAELIIPAPAIPQALRQCAEAARSR